MKKLLMTSAVLAVFALAALSFQLASCKKTEAQVASGNCPPATYPITGLWEGTYTTDQVTHDPTYVAFTIYPDGTFIQRSKVTNANEYMITRGTWTLTGNNFQYTDTTIIYSGGKMITKGSLIFRDNGTLSGGTWQNLTTQTYTGKYPTMTRINTK